MRPRNFHNVDEYVREILASADPFYRGPHRTQPAPAAEAVHPLDPRKTARDLGREPEPGPAPRQRR